MVVQRRVEVRRDTRGMQLIDLILHHAISGETTTVSPGRSRAAVGSRVIFHLQSGGAQNIAALQAGFDDFALSGRNPATKCPLRASSRSASSRSLAQHVRLGKEDETCRRFFWSEKAPVLGATGAFFAGGKSCEPKTSF
jgi:hypothetical protein